MFACALNRSVAAFAAAYGVCYWCHYTEFPQEAQLSPSDRAMRLVSSNFANYHATVQKLLIRQVLTIPMV